MIREAHKGLMYTNGGRLVAGRSQSGSDQQKAKSLLSVKVPERLSRLQEDQKFTPLNMGRG